MNFPFPSPEQATHPSLAVLGTNPNTQVLHFDYASMAVHPLIEIATQVANLVVSLIVTYPEQATHPVLAALGTSVGVVH